MTKFFRPFDLLLSGSWQKRSKRQRKDLDFYSVCFDAAWYKENTPSYKHSKMTPWQHFILRGHQSFADPCQYFSTRWYLERYPDVAASGMNSLVHYEKYGAKEGRSTSEDFDPSFYASYNGIDPSKENPLAHLLKKDRDNVGLTSMKSALKAIARGEKVFPSPDELFDYRCRATKHSTADTFISAPLSDGRTIVQTTEDLEFIKSPELELIALAMERERAHCLSPYLTHFRDTLIVPGSSNIITRKCVINDEIYALSQNGLEPKQQKLSDRVWKCENQLVLRVSSDEPKDIDCGIHLTKEYDQNYFHFMCEVVPRLFLIESTQLSSDIPLLVCDDLDERLYQILSVVKHPRRKVLRLKRNHPYHVKLLTYLSDVSNVTDAYEEKPDERYTFLPEDLLKKLSDQIIGGVEIEAQVAPKLFLSRSAKRRTIENEGALKAELLRRDFTVRDTATMSFVDQVNLFAQAKVIVGATGAVFANLLWCKPGTTVVILYPDHELNNTTFWTRLARVRDVKLIFLNGKRSKKIDDTFAMHDNFKVNVNELLDALS